MNETLDKTRNNWSLGHREICIQHETTYRSQGKLYTTKGKISHREGHSLCGDTNTKYIKTESQITGQYHK